MDKPHKIKGQFNTGLYGRDLSRDQTEELKVLLQMLQGNSTIHIYKPFLKYLRQTLEQETENISFVEFENQSDIDCNLDCLLSVGGDGTFLEASKFAVEHEIPILGINFGRLGFLAQVSAEEIEPALTDLFTENYTIEKRTLISVYDENNALLFANALNEIAIQRSSPAMLKTVVWIDNELLSSYWSDGILISTPTGSTAYSLSLGGPVMTPSNNSLIITPVAPHNLNIRPIVISDDSEILIKTETRKGNATLSLDNRMIELPPTSKFLVKKSQNVLNFIKLKNYNFLKTLQNKLNWGVDFRN